MWTTITKFFSADKVCLILFVVIICLGFLYDYVSTKSELANKKAELVILSDRVNEQNEAIKNLELDVETYKNKQPEIVEKIVTKYQTVVETKTINTCEDLSYNLFELNNTFLKGRVEK